MRQVEVDTIPEVFRTVASRKRTTGVVPFENSTAGRVVQTRRR